MKNFFVAVACLFAISCTFAQDEALKNDVMKIIKVNGSDAQVKMAKDQVLKMIPAEKQAAFLVEFEASLPALYDKMAKAYMETYTKEDIKALLAFYDTPAGKKITAKNDELLKKNQAAAQEWGQGLQPMLMRYMQ